MKIQSLKLPRLLHNPFFQLVIVGLISCIAYLDLALTYPLQTLFTKYLLTDFGRANGWSQSSLLDFLLALFVPFVLYLIAWRITSRHPNDRRLLWLVLVFAALFALSLLIIYPITSTDVFEYVFHSRILVHYGQNPLAVPPMRFQGDPFLKTVNWARHPSPYGPLWVLLTVPGSAIAGDDLILNVTLMHLLPVIFFIGCALMIAAILRHKNPKQQVVGTLLFAWNPLVLFEAPGNGHNGIIMMFFALCAIYFLVRRQWLWVIPALVASVLIKYITAILILPFLIYCLLSQEGRRNQIMYLVKTATITVLLVGVLILPFLQIPSGLLEEANFYSLLAVPSLAYNFLTSIYGDKIAKVLTLATTVIPYLVLYVLGLRTLVSRRKPNDLIVFCTFTLIAYLGIACMHFQPWFAIWPIALGIWVDHPLARRVLVVFTASALLSYAANFVWIWNYKTMPNFQVNVMFVTVIFLPPLLAGLLGYARAGRWKFVERLMVHVRV